MTYPKKAIMTITVDTSEVDEEIGPARHAVCQTRSVSGALLKINIYIYIINKAPLKQMARVRGQETTCGINKLVASRWWHFPNNFFNENEGFTYVTEVCSWRSAW